MDVAGVLMGAALVAVSMSLGLVMGHRMGQGKEPLAALPTPQRKTLPDPFEEEARWAARGYTDEGVAS